jgi:hypothetical protein
MAPHGILPQQSHVNGLSHCILDSHFNMPHARHDSHFNMPHARHDSHFNMPHARHAAYLISLICSPNNQPSVYCSLDHCLWPCRIACTLILVMGPARSAPAASTGMPSGMAG